MIELFNRAFSGSLQLSSEQFGLQLIAEWSAIARQQRRPEMRFLSRSPWALRARSIAPYGLGVLLMALVLLRAWTVESIYGPNANCNGCLAQATVGQDAWLLAFGFLLLAVAVGARQRVWRIAAVAIVLLQCLIMATDLSILNLLTLRLYLFDVIKFGAEWDASFQFLSAVRRQYPILLPSVILLSLGLFSCCLMPVPARPARARLLAIGSLAWMLLGCSLDRLAPVHVNSDAFVNLWNLHADQGSAQRYSGTFADQLAARYHSPPVLCEKGQSRRPNIILLVWESLSAYHSALGRTGTSVVPGFDSIARTQTWFSAFHANGFTTDHGLISLLTGEYPIPVPGRYSSLQAFAGFGDAESSIAGQLRPAGYSTNFFSTGDLGFLDKPEWFKRMNFDYWEGAEHPFYAGMPRGPFAAAEDRALYQRFLEWRGSRGAAPYLAVLLTVETHPPFLHRASGRLDEAASFRAADQALLEFYGQLQHAGFFENGLLIVLGDHRSMTPLQPAELSRSGEAALARVPMLVAGPSGLPAGEVSLPFQQTDLLPSLVQLTRSESCHRADQGRFLRTDPQPPSFIVHVRGDQRSRLDFYSRNGASALILRGDDSYWQGQAPGDPAAIADFVHARRISRGELPNDVPALLRLTGH